MGALQMESNRRNLSLNEFIKRKKGSALFVALMLSMIGLFMIGGLILVWQSLSRSLFPIKTYSSVREAAQGGVRLIAAYIERGYFDEMRYLECPQGTQPITNNCKGIHCCRVNLKYKLLDSNKIHDNFVDITFLGSQQRAVEGYQIGGTGAKGQNFLVYALNSTAYAYLSPSGEGSTGITSTIEATYLRVALH